VTQSVQLLAASCLDRFGEVHGKRATISGVPWVPDRKRAGRRIDARDHVHVVVDEIAARVGRCSNGAGDAREQL
jgi:hypothetical protein